MVRELYRDPSHIACAWKKAAPQSSPLPATCLHWMGLKLGKSVRVVHYPDPELHLGVINSYFDEICHCCCIAARHADHQTGGST